MDKLNVGFVYTIEHIGIDGEIKSTETVRNLIPDVGRDYFLNAALTGGSAFSSWYIGVYSGSYTPVAGSTMATIVSDATELSNYSGGARVALVPDALSGGVYANSTTKAEFVFTSGATVRGGFITSGSPHGGTTGVLLSAVLFPSPKVIESGETLKVVAGLALATS